jgi:hypothetical protein
MSLPETLMDKLLDSSHFQSTEDKDNFTDDVVSCLNNSVSLLTTLNEINLTDERCWRLQTNLMKTVRSLFELGLLGDIMPDKLIENHHSVCLQIAKQTCPLPDRSRELSFIKPDPATRSWWRRKIWALRHLLSFIRVSTLSMDFSDKCDLHDEIVDFCREFLENYRPDKNICTELEKTVPYYSQILQFVEMSTRFERSFEIKLFRLLCRYGPDENLLQESPVYERKLSNNHYIDHNLLKARIDFIDARALSRHALRNLYTQPLVNHVRLHPERLHPILTHFFESIYKQNDDGKIEVVLGVISLTFARLTQQERLRFNFPQRYIENQILNLFNHSTKYLRTRAMRFMTYWIDIPRKEHRDTKLVKRTINTLLKILVSENDVTVRIEAVTCLYNFRLNEQLAVDLAIAEMNKRSVALELSKTFRFAPINTNATIILMSVIKNHKDELASVYSEMMMHIDYAIREMIQVDVNAKKDLILLALNFYASMIEQCPDKKILAESEVRIIDTLVIVHKQYDYRLCSSAAYVQERLNTLVISRTSRRTFNFLNKLLKEPDHYFMCKPRYVSDDETKRIKHVIKLIKKNENQELNTALKE